MKKIILSLVLCFCFSQAYGITTKAREYLENLIERRHVSTGNPLIDYHSKQKLLRRELRKLGLTEEEDFKRVVFTIIGSPPTKIELEEPSHYVENDFLKTVRVYRVGEFITVLFQCTGEGSPSMNIVFYESSFVKGSFDKNMTCLNEGQVHEHTFNSMDLDKSIDFKINLF